MKMLMQFMVSDPFFQTQLINQISEQPNNDWLKGVSKDAQIRFLKIVTSIPPSKLSDQKTMNAIVKRLVNDKEIGPALTKKYGKNIPTELLSGLQAGISSGAVSHFRRAGA